MEWDGKDVLALYQNLTEEIRFFKNQQKVQMYYLITAFVLLAGLHKLKINSVFVLIIVFFIALLGTIYIISYHMAIRNNREAIGLLYAKLSKEFNECLPKENRWNSFFNSFWAFTLPFLVIIWVVALVLYSIIRQ